MVKTSLVTMMSLVAAFAVAGPTPNPTTNAVNFSTSVGSFKVLGLGPDPASGTLTFSFTGSVLVSGLDGTIAVGGNVHKEYENAAHKKVAYFGTGSITLTGKVRSVQWFGRDLKGRMVGKGLIRMYGEFDRNLNTGIFKYDGFEENPWGTGGMQVVLPKPIPRNQSGNTSVAPTVKDAGKG